MKHTLGLLEHSTLLLTLSDSSNDFFNNGASSSSSSSSDLFIPLHFFGESSILRINDQIRYIYLLIKNLQETGQTFLVLEFCLGIQ